MKSVKFFNQPYVLFDGNITLFSFGLWFTKRGIGKNDRGQLIIIASKINRKEEYFYANKVF